MLHDHFHIRYTCGHTLAECCCERRYKRYIALPLPCETCRHSAYESLPMPPHKHIPCASWGRWPLQYCGYPEHYHSPHPAAQKEARG